MAPWPCPPLSPKDTPCTGGADDYLKLLVSEIIPKAKELVRGVPSHISLAEYSLADLFALYACYTCDVFDRVGSISGSLWFSDFKEYVFYHSMNKTPDRIYLSLGDTEAKTRDMTLKMVQNSTEGIFEHYKSLGIDVAWELNSGNHFKNAA